MGSIRIIDFETVKKIGSMCSNAEYYDWVDHVFRNKDSFFMPVKSRMSQDNGDYYAVMPSLYPEKNIATVKMIGRHLLKENEKRSVMMSDVMIYEADTGVLKAVMDAEYITTLRTGANAAHSAILYGKKDFSVIGLIGLGNIMTVCVDVLLDVITDRQLTIKLYRHHDQEIRLMERYKDKKNVTFVLCDTYEETIRGSEVIISAVTRVTENFCTDDCYDEGCTVIPIMTLGFQNCDLFFDRVFSDEIDQIRGFKYFDKFKEIANTNDVLNGRADGRRNDRERILVYNYGLSILDTYFAYCFLEKAENCGEEVKYNFCTEKFFM